MGKKDKKVREKRSVPCCGSTHCSPRSSRATDAAAGRHASMQVRAAAQEAASGRVPVQGLLYLRYSTVEELLQRVRHAPPLAWHALPFDVQYEVHASEPDGHRMQSMHLLLLMTPREQRSAPIGLHGVKAHPIQGGRAAVRLPACNGRRHKRRPLATGMTAQRCGSAKQKTRAAAKQLNRMAARKQSAGREVGPGAWVHADRKYTHVACTYLHSHNARPCIATCHMDGHPGAIAAGTVHARRAKSLTDVAPRGSNPSLPCCWPSCCCRSQMAMRQQQAISRRRP